jgi:hypothetical protein
LIAVEYPLFKEFGYEGTLPGRGQSEGITLPNDQMQRTSAADARDARR